MNDLLSPDFKLSYATIRDDLQKLFDTQVSSNNAKFNTSLTPTDHQTLHADRQTARKHAPQTS